MTSVALDSALGGGVAGFVYVAVDGGLFLLV
jgi:hypothetical protein